MTINNKTVLAIIPARQGSTRCPDKNITCYGPSLKPLIQHAIDHAQGSKYIDTILISSDSDLILRYAVPPVIALKRPDYLSTSIASSESVIIHALYTQPTLPDFYPPPPLPDLFVLLQPTSPLRTPEDIDACIKLSFKGSLNNSRTQTVVSVDEQGKNNGAVYVSETKTFLSRLNLNAFAHYKMPNSRSLDIDYPEDFFKEFTVEGSWKLKKP